MKDSKFKVGKGAVAGTWIVVRVEDNKVMGRHRSKKCAQKHVRGMSQ